MCYHAIDAILIEHAAAHTKRNLDDVGMDQWMHWLTKLTNKGMPHSDMHSITQPHYWIMWPCYGVHITVWHSLLVCFVSQCIHWFIPTSTKFLLRNLFMETTWSRPVHTDFKYRHKLPQDTAICCMKINYSTIQPCTVQCKVKRCMHWLTTTYPLTSCMCVFLSLDEKMAASWSWKL